MSKKQPISCRSVGLVLREVHLDEEAMASVLRMHGVRMRNALEDRPDEAVAVFLDARIREMHEITSDSHDGGCEGRQTTSGRQT